MDKNNRKRELLFSAAFVLLLSSPNLLYWWLTRDSKAVTALLLSMMLLYGILRLLRNHPRLLLGVGLILGLYACADLIHLLDYGAHISVGAVGAIFDTDPKEATEFLLSVSATTLPAIATFLVAGILLAWFYPGRRSTDTSRRYLMITLLLITLPVIDFAAKGSTRHAAPMAPIRAFAEYLGERAKLQALLRERHHFHFDATRRSDGGPEHHVLILGESVRRDHLQQYGYPRATSPRLAARDDLVLFTDVVSPANQTRRAVKMMLSPATAVSLDDFYRQGTIIGLAREAGLRTAWLSNQGRYGKHDTEISSIGREADETVFTNTDWDTLALDEQLLAPFHACSADGSRPRFTVVHLLGSHADYRRRYPAAFEHFADTPPGGDGKDRRSIDAINAYDNSLRYTDSIVADIIDTLDGSNASGCAVYTADHGEVLGEIGGRFTHGFPTVHRAEAEVPFMVWCSRRYRQRHPDIWTRLQANRNRPFSTEHLFNLLADLMQIDYAGKEPATSPANAAFTPPATRFLLGTSGRPTSYESFAATETGE